MWLQDLIAELGIIEESTSLLLHQDNQGEIFIQNDNCNKPRTKHIDIKYHFIRENVKEGRIKIVYCPTDKMIADIFTEPPKDQKL